MEWRSQYQLQDRWRVICKEPMRKGCVLSLFIITFFFLYRKPWFQFPLGLKFLVGAGFYESKEEAAKGEEVLFRIRQARVFFKKINYWWFWNLGWPCCNIFVISWFILHFVIGLRIEFVWIVLVILEVLFY